MNRGLSRRAVIIGSTAIGSVLLIALYSYFFFFSARAAGIHDFDYARDMADVASVFERNRYWLTSIPDSSVEYAMRHRAAYPDPRYWGTLTTKVMRDHENNFLGFVSYFMERRTEGKVLFLAINEPFRGKGYSNTLLAYAVNALRDRGALAVNLVTRTSNVRAQKIYHRVGFVETKRDDEFVYFLYRF